MIFNLNEFLISVSVLLDAIETDIFGVPTNHSKRIAFISLRVASELGMSSQDVFDLISYSLLHDNGASLKILHDKLRGDSREKLSLIESMQEHCIIGEQNIASYPFLNRHPNIVKYHHERYDGTGFFKLFGNNIPIMSQIINFADSLDLNFDIRNVTKGSYLEEDIFAFIKQQKGIWFSPEVVDAFFRVLESSHLWNKLSDEEIDKALTENTPQFSKEFTYEEIHDITKTFSKIIDAKSKFTQEHSSGLAAKLEILADYYNVKQENKMKLLIAADLHDLGKLGVSNSILDKEGNLSAEEFDIIKNHPNVTRKCLEVIKGFEDIAEWAGNHHEKLNGVGYPRGLQGKELDFYSRLLACLDIYQALREDRPYRRAMSHSEAIPVLFRMAKKGLIDSSIVRDINYIFY